jgi:5-guanidino-2-oxopentanoate decarboxylase
MCHVRLARLLAPGSFVMPMEMERCWYYSGTYCSLGVALPMAIGAKIGAPHRPVIAVAGDGGIMFTVNELATAAEERLALPVIVWNNDALKEIHPTLIEVRQDSPWLLA